MAGAFRPQRGADVSDPAVHDYLASRGWLPTGRVTTRGRGSGFETITWWARGAYLYPQFLALDLERFGLVWILETMP